MVDNDSCFGGHTIKSHNDILTQFEFIHDKVINGINNTLNETSSSSLFEMDTSILFWNMPIALIISSIARLTALTRAAGFETSVFDWNIE